MARGERILAGELVATSVITGARELRNGRVPHPRQFFAMLVVFSALSIVSLVSEDAGDLAAGIGGLVLLTALMTFPDITVWLTRASETGFQDAPPASKDRPAGIQNPLSDLWSLITGGSGTNLVKGITG